MLSLTAVRNDSELLMKKKTPTSPKAALAATKHRIMMHAMTRKTIIVFVSFLLCAILVHTIVDFRTVFSDNPVYVIGLDAERKQLVEDDFLYGSKLIINTTGCKIPRTPIIPSYFKSKWHVEKLPICDYETVLSVLAEDQIIRLNPEYANSKCCLHEITRIDNEDKDYKISPCQEFTTFADVSQKEMLLTKCRKSLNFDVNLAIKPPVQKKIDYWKTIPKEDIPPTVIIFGVDTMSRSHAFRSLPKTIALMKKMGFVDFKGYHSLAPSTLNNFMGFLMGLPREEVRSGCAPNWTSPFDSCPLIWKDFSLQNYITMYVEDGSQTFNWGGQSGFHEKPTDYYIHALFNAIKDLRNKNSVWKNEDKLDCTSNESVPEFVVRYTERFVRKFREVPFFSFTWLEDPFHDNQFTLAQLDNHILRFFQLLNAIPDLLDRSLLVFLSDHGDRFSFFQTKSVEGFIERSLPPLMIRFPKNLEARFPEHKKILEITTEALTSPFDLHHTLMHILSMAPGWNKSVHFEPMLKDRSSLFFPVSLNRTCDIVHVQAGNCVCGTSTDVDPIENPYYLTKIMEFAESRLNKLVSSSNYHRVCHKWTATVDNLISSRVLKVTDNYTDNLIQFNAMPGNATFEVKIKVLHANSKYDGCELIGEFERVNSYGNQSFCVKFETDEDKKMKELCICNSLVKEDPHPT